MIIYFWNNVNGRIFFCIIMKVFIDFILNFCFECLLFYEFYKFYVILFVKLFLKFFWEKSLKFYCEFTMKFWVFFCFNSWKWIIFEIFYCWMNRECILLFVNKFVYVFWDFANYFLFFCIFFNVKIFFMKFICLFVLFIRLNKKNGKWEFKYLFGIKIIEKVLLVKKNVNLNYFKMC